MARARTSTPGADPSSPNRSTSAGGGDSAPERWLANIRISGFTFIVLVLLVLGVVVLAPSLKLLIEQRQQISALQKSVNSQQNDVSKLKDQVARWNDPAYIVSQARNRLLFVYPGEYSYLVIENDTSGTASDSTPISDKIQNTKTDWVGSLTSSLLTSGLTKAPASQLTSPSSTPSSAPSSAPGSK